MDPAAVPHARPGWGEPGLQEPAAGRRAEALRAEPRLEPYSGSGAADFATGPARSCAPSPGGWPAELAYDAFGERRSPQPSSPPRRSLQQSSSKNPGSKLPVQYQ